MTTFDFITDEDLRASLEADYHELTISASNAAWKAAHVLAGSIIEALLVDYLLAIRSAGAGDKDPLRLDLSELIAKCTELGILSDRTEKLATVVRGYRNLIHPGRMLRLSETVNESSAQVAKALVDMIVREVEAKRRETYGYTAEQVIDKIVHDPSALSILPHLLRDMQPIEIERLLIHVFPSRYFEYIAEYPERYEPREPSPMELELDRTISSLEECFTTVYNIASEEVRAKVTHNFVRILREERGANVVAYEDACFRCSELKYLSAADAEIVIKHILSRYSGRGGGEVSALLGVIQGIGPHLTRAGGGADLAQAICSTILRQPSWRLKDIPKDANFTILTEYETMPDVARSEFDQRWDQWIQSAAGMNQSEVVEVLEDLRNWWLPASGGEDE